MLDWALEINFSRRPFTDFGLRGDLVIFSVSISISGVSLRRVAALVNAGAILVVAAEEVAGNDVALFPRFNGGLLGCLASISDKEGKSGEEEATVCGAILEGLGGEEDMKTSAVTLAVDIAATRRGRQKSK